MDQGKQEELTNPIDTETGNGINPKMNIYPFCIVWGMLPPLTWLFPFIGHLGIGDSTGRIHDFAGPYYIGVNDFMTGPVFKYLEFSPSDLKCSKEDFEQIWNQGIEDADEVYKKRMVCEHVGVY